jgi:hypothetical protein
MSYQIHDFVGNVGVACVLLTYLLLQLGRLSGTSILYSGLNALGAVLILVSLIRSFNLSSFIIEICWLAISLLGIARAWWQGRAGQPSADRG